MNNHTESVSKMKDVLLNMILSWGDGERITSVKSKIKIE